MIWGKATFELCVDRVAFSDSATLSNVYLKKIDCGTKLFLCHGLEDAFRDVKIHGETCIPNGSYNLALKKSGRFHLAYTKRFHGLHQGMVWVRGVPNFTGILWHIGNTNADTKGCLLLGERSGGKLVNSKNTYKKVYGLISPLIKHEIVQKVSYFSLL